ncbi:hypothetical protein ACLI08_08790 [Flavobacterium sp. RNTU_13]|uniref:hypothetical protein n=1 Tax=Flavobacterium sp. RNTU_13 TaxID=3375145 RepID=UPI0039864EDC
MMKKFIAITALFVVAFITGCSLSNNEPYCYSAAAAPITSVTGPDTGQVNTPLTFTVLIQAASSCGELDRFYESTTGFPKDISAIVKYEGCNCDNKVTSLSKQYTFTAAASGTYTLRFTTANSAAPIVKTITITQ